MRNLDREAVEITSQNHGFAVESGEGDQIPGRAGVTFDTREPHDGTAEGVKHRDFPVISVQYHPGSCAGSAR